MIAASFVLCEEDYTSQHETGLLLRDTLLQACGFDPTAYTFVKSDTGKPYAPGAPFSFSISHSHKLCACAIATPDNVTINFAKLFTPDGLNLRREPCSAAEDLAMQWNGIALVSPLPCRQIGADIERIDQAADPARLAKLGERFLKERPETWDAQSFYHCWTRQEAWGKLCGKGVFAPLPTEFAVKRADFCITDFQLQSYAFSICAELI